MMRWVLISTALCLMTVGRMPIVAQEDEAEDIPLAPVVIDVAELVDLTGENPQLVVEGSLGTGCDLPVMVDQAQDGDTLTVWLYQDVDAATICPAILLPYSDTIPLAVDPAGSVTTVIVNGRPAPIGGDESGDPVMPPVVESVRFEAIPQEDSPAVVLWQLVVTCAEGELCNGSADVMQQNTPGRIVVRFAPGTSSGGELIVPLEDEIRLHDDWAENELFAGAVVVEVNDYTGVAYADQTVTLVSPEDEETTYVNRFATGTDGEQVTPLQREVLMIERVTPLIDPQTPGVVGLNVAATQSNGCDVPVLTFQEPLTAEASTGAITVSVYTVQPRDIMCPAVLTRHEIEITLQGPNEDGTFPPGTYTASINEQSVTFTIF